MINPSEFNFANRDNVIADTIMGDPDGTSGNHDEGAWEDMEGFHLPLPGEEAMFMSYAGGENEVFHDIINTVISKK